MKRFISSLISLVATVLVMLGGLSAPVQAAAPAGSLLQITVTSTSDQGEQPSDAEWGVTIVLSPAAPTLSSQLTLNESHSETVSEIRYRYTITTNANGADVYNLTFAEGASTNTAGPPEAYFESSVVQNTGPGTFTVGLNATAALTPHSAGEDRVHVQRNPWGEDEINLEGGDTVVIGGVTYKIANIGAPSNDYEKYPQLQHALDPQSIVLETPLVSDVSVGELIAEQKAFEVSFYEVKIDDDNLPAVLAMVLTASSASDESLSAQDETLTSLYLPADPSIEVFVRNLTAPITGVDPAYTSIAGDDFYSVIPDYDADLSAGESPWKVSAGPGDTLQYAIVQNAGNNAAKAPLTNVVLQASMPSYTTYVPGSTTLNAVSLVDVGDPAQSQVVDGIVVQSPGNIAGTISINSLAEVTFQVELQGASSPATQTPEPEADLMPWMFGMGDACWNETWAETHDHGWVMGPCVGAPLGEWGGQNQCNSIAQNQFEQGLDLKASMNSMKTVDPSNYNLVACF